MHVYIIIIQRKNIDWHVLLRDTNLFKENVINMGIRLCNKVPVNVKKWNEY